MVPKRGGRSLFAVFLTAAIDTGPLAYGGLLPPLPRYRSALRGRSTPLSPIVLR